MLCLKRCVMLAIRIKPCYNRLKNTYIIDILFNFIFDVITLERG